MRHGPNHLVWVFVLPLVLQLSLGAHGQRVYCVGSDGHRGVEWAGVTCCTSKAIQAPERVGIGQTPPLLCDLESCVDIPISTITQCSAAQRSADELAILSATFMSAAIAFPDISLAAGLTPTAPSGPLPPALPRASLRTVILLV